jgi:hypothetical protein
MFFKVIFSLGMSALCFFCSTSVKGRIISCFMSAFSRIYVDQRLKTSENSSSRSVQISTGGVSGHVLRRVFHTCVEDVPKFEQEDRLPC